MECRISHGCHVPIEARCRCLLLLLLCGAECSRCTYYQVGHQKPWTVSTGCKCQSAAVPAPRFTPPPPLLSMALTAAAHARCHGSSQPRRPEPLLPIPYLTLHSRPPVCRRRRIESWAPGSNAFLPGPKSLSWSPSVAYRACWRQVWRLSQFSSLTHPSHLLCLCDLYSASLEHVIASLVHYASIQLCSLVSFYSPRPYPRSRPRCQQCPPSAHKRATLEPAQEASRQPIRA